jgi:hypothetical protein
MEGDLIGVDMASLSVWVSFVADVHNGEWNMILIAIWVKVGCMIEATFSTSKLLPFTIFEMDLDFVLT